MLLLLVVGLPEPEDDAAGQLHGGVRAGAGNGGGVLEDLGAVGTRALNGRFDVEDLHLQGGGGIAGVRHIAPEDAELASLNDDLAELVGLAVIVNRKLEHTGQPIQGLFPLGGQKYGLHADGQAHGASRVGSGGLWRKSGPARSLLHRAFLEGSLPTPAGVASSQSVQGVEGWTPANQARGRWPREADSFLC